MSPASHSALAKLVALRSTNTPIQTIATALNRSPKTIHSLIAKHNLPRWPGHGPRLHTPELITRVLMLRTAGRSYKEIAVAKGLTIYQVTGIVRRAAALAPLAKPPA